MRAAIRVLLTLVVLALVAFLLLGYWTGSTWGRRDQPSEPVATSGSIDVDRARDRGAALAEKAAVAAAEVQETVNEAALTAKIKAKMALDDSVKARAINVTTSGSTVTVTGSVRSGAERARAVALARETVGVSEVIDRLTVKP